MDRNERRADFQNDLFENLRRTRSSARPSYVLQGRYIIGEDLPGTSGPVHYATRFNWDNPRDRSDSRGTPEVVLVLIGTARTQIASLAANERSICATLGSGSSWYLNLKRWNLSLKGPSTDLSVPTERARAIEWATAAMERLVSTTRHFL